MEKKIEELVEKKIGEQYDKFLELLPKIIHSAVKSVEHHTAPGTDKRLIELEKAQVKNTIEHGEIKDSLLKIEKYSEEIIRGIEARGWLRKFIKDWWFIIAAILGSAWVIFQVWLENKLNK